MSRPLVSTPWVERLVLLVATLGAAACLWAAWCEFPIYSWNEVRLAPAFALRHGINPYPPLGGGPLSTWIYGPVGILVNLPATFASTPVGALQIASLINGFILLAPLAVIFFGSEELRARGPAARWFALTLGVMLVPRPNLVLQVADHAAIAFGLLSCWCLARRAQPTVGRLAVAAALCALAVWAKQIAIFLVPAQIAFLFLGGERTAARQYLAAVAFFGLIAFAGAGWAFGFGNLWLNLVTIPGRLPWIDDVPARFAMRQWSLLAQLVLPAIGLVVMWRAKFWPGRATESGRFFHLAAWAAAAMLPVGLAAYLKIGGDTNLLHSWDYLLPGALLAWLAADRFSRSTPARLLAVTALAVALRWSDLVALPAGPFCAHFESAARLTAAYPRAIWFPRNPLITFYADRELWHSEDGIQTRFLANYGIRAPDFRRHLPPDLQAVAYPSVVEFPFAMPLLAELNTTDKLPYWTVHRRAAPPDTTEQSPAAR